MEEEWCWVSPDGLIKKRTVSVGTSRIHPFDSSKCLVKFLEVNIKDGEFHTFLPEKGEEKELVVGLSENIFDRALERLIQTMVSQEVAESEMRLKDVVCQIKVQLISCPIPLKPLHRLNEEEKLAEAEKIKNRASQLINENRFEDAVNLLNRAHRCVCWAGGNITDEGVSDLYISVVANLSLCSLKLGDNERTVALCSRILQLRPHHVKCLLRRATALDCLQETEKAKEDVLAAISIEPNNKAAENLLDKIRDHMAKQKTDFTLLAKKMLHL